MLEELLSHKNNLILGSVILFLMWHIPFATIALICFILLYVRTGFSPRRLLERPIVRQWILKTPLMAKLILGGPSSDREGITSAMKVAKKIDPL